MDSLYEDIDVVGDSAEIQKLHDQIKLLQEQLLKKDKDSEELNKQIQIINGEKLIVERNMVALYNTALAEVNRKDREIKELRTELLHYKKNVT
jgi:hypothetical protein